jgi:HEAT repeat protein
VDVLAVFTLALLVGFVAWTVVFFIARQIAVRRDRQEAAAQASMRPLALRIVMDDETPEIESLSPAEVAALATLVARFGRRLRGQPRHRLNAFFQQTGLVDQQRKELARRSAWRRAAAAFSLGDMADADSVPRLVAALHDRDRAVRIAAARSLGSLAAAQAGEDLVASIVDGRVPWLVGGQTLIDMGADVAPTLRRLAAAPTSPLRPKAIELLGYVGDASDGAAVADVLTDNSAELRERAARALGRLGSRDSIDALCRTLADPEPAVAAAAATALGAMHARASIDDLLALARSGEFEAAGAAARAVGRIDARRLLAAADEPDAGPHLQEAADVVGL